MAPMFVLVSEFHDHDGCLLLAIIFFSLFEMLFSVNVGV